MELQLDPLRPTAECPRGGWRIRSGNVNVIVCPTAHTNDAPKWARQPAPPASTLGPGPMMAPRATPAGPPQAPQPPPIPMPIEPAPAPPAGGGIARIAQVRHNVTGTGEQQYAVSLEPSGGHFECSLDGGAYHACTSEVTFSESAIGFGRHLLRVRIQGVRQTPAEQVFWFLQPIKEARIVGGSASVDAASVDFEGPAGEQLECSFDNGPWTACQSPQSWSGLSSGEHVFRVRSRSQTAPPAEHRWNSHTPTEWAHAVVTNFWTPARQCLVQVQATGSPAATRFRQMFAELDARLQGVLRIPDMARRDAELLQWLQTVYDQPDFAPGVITEPELQLILGCLPRI